MQLIKYSPTNSVYQNFEKEKDFLIENHNQKLKKSTVEKKSYILQNTIKCFGNSLNSFDLSMCKNKEEESFIAFAHSYEDNQKIQNSLNKDELINRYEIRIDLARIDRMYDRVKMFSQTLSCFKKSSDLDDIKDCKSEEKKRIYNLIRS